jgi:hypothetical protein
VGGLYSICNNHPLDLYAESRLIYCEHERSRQTGETDRFAGLENYLKESFCDWPFRKLEVATGGACYLCCPGWLPLTVGNVKQQSFEQIWNSQPAKDIREAIVDGSFRFCSKIHCPSIANRQLPKRSQAAQLVKIEVAPAPVPASVEAPHPPEIVSAAAITPKGPNWVHLSQRNLEELDAIRSEPGSHFSLVLAYVVSSLNYREMPAFIALAKRFHVEQIIFTIVRNWDHLTRTEFAQMNIASPDHADHADFLQTLNAPELADPIVNLGSVKPLQHS